MPHPGGSGKLAVIFSPDLGRPRVRNTFRLLPLSLCIALALPAQAADDDENWGMCPIRDSVPAFGDVPKQDGVDIKQPRTSLPTDVEGDELLGTEQEDTLVQGNVKLKRGDQFLGTDELSLNNETGEYRAEGSVRYQDSGMRIVANRAEGNQNTDIHTISELKYQLIERRGNGGAEKIELHGDQGALIGSTYSTCPPEQRVWELRARRIDVDTKEGMGVARGATLRIGKVPVLHVPYFAFPIDDRRRTGLLYPAVAINGRNGVDWRQPIYINLAPNYDATLNPRYMSKRGAMLGGEFRWLYGSGRGEMYGNWMPSDDLPNSEPDRYLKDSQGRPLPNAQLPDENRGQFGLTAAHNFNRTWYASTALGWVSDKHYLEDFSNSLFGVSSYYIASSAGIFGRGRHWDASLTADHYQLADYTLTEASLPYHRLPRAFASWTRPIGKVFEVGVGAEAVRFQHKEVESGTRIEIPGGSRVDVKPFVGMNLEGDSWFMRPRLAWRHTAYQLDPDLATQLATSRATTYANSLTPPVAVTPDLVERFREGSPSRSVPIASFDAGMYFDRETNLFGNDYLHTLEPRLFYLRVPYEDQSMLPLFDTAGMTFSWGQLFRDNRYTGPDRQTDANQLTAAVSTRFISSADGRERLSASFGQIRYFKASQVVAPGEIPIEEGKSSWVTDVAWMPSDRWTVNAGYQWDPKFRGRDLTTARARYLLGDTGVVNLGYRYRRNPGYDPLITNPLDPASNKASLEQADFSFVYPITTNWSLVGRYYYSLLDKKELETVGGVQWESCCLAVRTVVRRYVRDRSGDLNTGLMLEVELKGLGSAGQKSERVLRRAILGYDRDDLYLVPPSSVQRTTAPGSSADIDQTP